MRGVHNFWYYYSQTFVSMVIFGILLVGVIVFLLVENNEQRETILKLRLEIIDLKYSVSKQELKPRVKSLDYWEYELWDRERYILR